MLVDAVFMGRVSDKVEGDLFSNKSYNIVAQFFKNFWNKYSKLPSNDEIKLFGNDNAFLTALKEVFSDIHTIDLNSIDKDILYKSAEKFIKEKLAISTLNSVIDKMGKSEIDPTILVDKFEKIAGISLLFDKGYDIYKDVNRYIESIKSAAARLPTGFAEIDKNINGGVLADGKCLSIVAAPTNMGKSILLGNIAVNAAKSGKNVLVISLEMSEEVYASRLYSALYNLPINSLSFMT